MRALLCASLVGGACAAHAAPDRHALPSGTPASDVRAPSEALAFPRMRPAHGGIRPRTSIGAGWRHEYDIVLSADGAGRVVHDANARTHRFVPSGTGSPLYYSAATPGSGTLARDGGGHLWRRPDGAEIDFVGSLAHVIRGSDGRSLRLRYAADGRLGSVTDVDTGETLRFGYDSRRRLRDVRRTDGTLLRLDLGAGGTLLTRTIGPPECRAEDPGAPIDEEPPGRCDAATSPPGETFLDAPGVPGAIRIDARPASCRSYFADFAGTERGFAIESGLAAHGHYAGYTSTVRSFPIVDFVGAELRVVRSRDLSLASYASVPDGLYRRLLADGEAIGARLIAPLERDGRITVGELGRTTTLAHDPERPVVLELVVRHGLASADHILQIERARTALLAARGILLRVIEIP